MPDETNTSSKIACPSCSRTLTPLAVGRIVVDACHQGCGGIWFDYFELQRFDEVHEGEGKMLANVERAEGVQPDQEKRLRCPRCSDVVLRRHFFSVNQKVVVDSCPGCGGYWLDHGELALIRSEFPTAQARDRAAERFVDELDQRYVRDPCPQTIAKADQVRSIAAMFAIVGSRYVQTPV